MSLPPDQRAYLVHESSVTLMALQQILIKRENHFLIV